MMLCLGTIAFIVMPKVNVMAEIQYWNPTTTAKAAGSNDWDTAVGAWADTSSGTTTPQPWINGNDAWFDRNSGVNSITVNGVYAGLLYFNEGTIDFWAGTGPLYLADGFTNRNATVTFYNDITLTDDQEWDVRRTTTVAGILGGPYTLKRTAPSSTTAYLNLSNANNTVSGLFIESGNVAAYEGGNAIGGPDATLTLGSPDQTRQAKLDVYPLNDQSETVWAVGPVVAGGLGEIASKVTTSGVTNRIAFGALTRTNRGVLSLRQESGSGAFENRQAITFENADEIVENGMLPPWIASQSAHEFLCYDGMVKGISYKNEAPYFWTESDIIINLDSRTLEADAAVHAIKVEAPLSVPEGTTLKIGSGGIRISGSTLGGGGMLESGTDELIVYAPWTDRVTAIYPGIAVTDLTLWGGGTLTVSNITWTGSTYIHQGTLEAIFDEDIVLDGRQITGLGSFTKEGPGALTLQDLDSHLNTFTWRGGTSLSLIDTVLDTKDSFTIRQDGSELLISNSYLKFGNNAGSLFQTASGVSDSETIVSAGSWLDAGGKGGLRIGQGGGSNNRLVIDGGGVTGGTVVTNMMPQDAKGLALGTGTGSSGNILQLINGGQIWDEATVNNAGNNFGVGTGANSNLMEVVGGAGFVTTLRKGMGNTIGSASTGNVVRVDAKGVPGSAVWLIPANNAIAVGTSGGFNNELQFLGGAKVTGAGLVCGDASNSNRVMAAGSGTEWKGNGGGAEFSIGLKDAEGNVVEISDGAYLWNFTTWQGCIGGRSPNMGNYPGTTSRGNKLIIRDGGRFLTSNITHVGHQAGEGATSINNEVVITGTDALWTSSNDINLGASSSGSKAIGNRIIVENEGRLTSSRRIEVGRLSSTEGTAADENGLIVRNGGTVRIPYYTYFNIPYGVDIGSTVTNDEVVVTAENNYCLVTDNGVLDVPVLKILSDGGNNIRFENGGVWQLSGRRDPSIISREYGDISMNNGIVAFAESSSFEVRDNWRGGDWEKVHFTGNNGLRLNDISLSSSGINSYLFEPDISPTNWAFLQMVNGTTVYRSSPSDDGALIIGENPGSSAEMLCSNTTASVELPFVLNGDLTIYNSTLTLQDDVEIGGNIMVDLDLIAEGNTALDIKGDLTVKPPATIQQKMKTMRIQVFGEEVV